MKRSNFIISVVCGCVVLSELSSAGQLTFAFPFVTQSLQLAGKVPASYNEVASTLGENIDNKVGNIEVTEAPKPVPNPVQCNILSFSNEQLAALQVAGIETKTKTEIETILGSSNCISEGYTLYDNGTAKIAIQYTGETVSDVKLSDKPI